jgi:hypothetical protein
MVEKLFLGTAFLLINILCFDVQYVELITGRHAVSIEVLSEQVKT